MRINSGWAKGLILKTPLGQGTRPTASRVRGAILNMVADSLHEALVLDLFAGSGAMGLEAVSRGARGAYFVEQDRVALAALKANTDELLRRAGTQELEVGPVEILPRSVETVLNSGPAASSRGGAWGPFDVVFVDPPYADAGAWADLILKVLPRLVRPEGLVVYETAAGAGAQLVTLAAERHGWTLLKQRAYGDTMVTLMENPEMVQP